MLQRVTISLDEQLAADFENLISAQGYKSRSEAVRDLVREAVEYRRISSAQDGPCVASLSYVYDHHTRALAQRLVEIQHDHHDIVVSTTHVHLDHNACLETTILKGATRRVQALADAVRSERGVRFAEVNLISVEPGGDHVHRVAVHDHVHTAGHP